MEFESYITREAGNYLWDAFCDPAGLGVNVAALLKGAAAVGLQLTDEEIDSILSHGGKFGEWNEFQNWPAEDEIVRQEIADATDLKDFKAMLTWLTAVVGEEEAAGLVKEWQEEAREIVSRFDRCNFNRAEDSITLPVKEWWGMLEEELKETDDPDDRDAIKAAAALIEDEDPDALAIQYVMDDPADFTVLPYQASTREEKILCRDLALN